MFAGRRVSSKSDASLEKDAGMSALRGEARRVRDFLSRLRYVVRGGPVRVARAVRELPKNKQYLVMQFVERQPLDRILEEGPLPVTRALRIIRAIASALSETHAAGGVHRDLKPSNIMWQRDRNGV